MNKFNRDSAFSMSLSGKNPSETDAINSMIALDGRFFCFSEKSIKEILPADKIDPKNECPNTRHSYQAVYDIGTCNSFVARTIIQSNEVLKPLVLRKGLDKQLILNHIWTCSKLLFNCENSYYKIATQTTGLMHECDSLINNHKDGAFIPQLPQVEDLEQHVVSFLGFAKRFLEETHGFLCIFYDSPEYGANFNNYRNWMAKNRPDSDKLIGTLEQDKDWVKLIAWQRNALDANHSKPKFKVDIENFKLHKGNKLSNPSWRYDFRGKKNGCLQKEASDIVIDMGTYLKNMLTFFEEIFILCVMDNWDNDFNFKILRLPEDKVNKRCPLIYIISLDIINK